MPESWRNILERAASNLSIELDQKTGPGFKQQPAGWPAPRLPSQKRPNSPADNRDLLARELEAISTPSPVRRPREPKPRERASGYPVTVSKALTTVRQPAQAPQQRAGKNRRNPTREFAVLSISVAIVVLAVYGFLFLLK